MRSKNAIAFSARERRFSLLRHSARIWQLTYFTIVFEINEVPYIYIRAHWECIASSFYFIDLKIILFTITLIDWWIFSRKPRFLQRIIYLSFSGEVQSDLSENCRSSVVYTIFPYCCLRLKQIYGISSGLNIHNF